MKNSSLFTESLLFSVTNGTSAIVCLLAAILVFALKLHKKVVYRLALYQVLAALSFATVETLQIVFIHYKAGTANNLCTAIGWLVVYTQWTKLMFTMWITLHLFCFAVCYKNPKKLEVLYVVTSLLVPAVVACVPLGTHSYRLSTSRRCYIYAENKTDSDEGVVVQVENFVLWDGPAFAILLAASIVMAAVVTKLARRLLTKVFVKYEAISPDRDQFWRAFKQILPLAVFPMLFLVSMVPLALIDIYAALGKKISPPPALLVSNGVLISLWGMASGITILVHITVARCGAKKRSHIRYAHERVSVL